MKADRGNFIKSLTLLLIFYGCCFIAFYFLNSLSENPTLLNAPNFLNWDAMHYDTIRREQYATGMVAFFPLFPFVWKITHLGPVGISIFNGLLYCISFAWIAAAFQIRKRNLVLLASLPGLVFMFLPYSEALFFFCCTILLAGLRTNNNMLSLVGIILAGFARPVATVFIPALFILFLLDGNEQSKTAKNYILLAIACILSFVFVLVYQFFQTGDAFSFFRIQKDWGNYLRWPAFPLNSWAGGFILRLDAIAFFTGIAALSFLGYLLLKKKGNQPSLYRDYGFIFSVCYLAFLSIIILATRGGILNSLNRYLLCTAFFIVSMNRVLDLKLFYPKNIIFLAVGTTLLWLAFGSYVHIQTFLKFELLTGYLLLLLGTTSENPKIISFCYYAVLATNIIFMMIFFQRFLSGEWVG